MHLRMHHNVSPFVHSRLVNLLQIPRVGRRGTAVHASAASCHTDSLKANETGGSALKGCMVSVMHVCCSLSEAPLWVCAESQDSSGA